ncbi:MAG: hypothetical protein ACREFX_03230 [Opitutaceae bacterium]
MAKFIVVTPPFAGNSFGIKTLHHLAHTLNEVGHDARLMFMAVDAAGNQRFGYLGPEATHPAYRTPPLKPADGFADETCIVVYPEIVSSNPLGGTRVVRYFLNAEAKVTGRKIALSARDFLLAFHRIYRPEAQFILNDVEFNPAFNARGTRPIGERTLDLTYVGKGDKYGAVKTIAGSVLITREWPANQTQLAALLRQTRFLYTWDAVSAINPEAVLCGAMPVFLRYDPITREEVDATDLGPLPRLDAGMKNFRFDPAEFERGRAALAARIEEIRRNWSGRVAEFAEAAVAHFTAEAVPGLESAVSSQ